MNLELVKSFYKQYRSPIFMISTGIASLVLIGVLIIPQIIILIDNNKAYQDITTKSKFLEVKATDLQKINQEELKNKLDASFIALPADKDLNNTIGIMQSIVASSGFGLQSLSFSSTTEEKQSFGVKLEVTGPKDSLNKLLTGLESSYRPLRVRTLDMISPKSGNIISGTIGVDVFFAPIPDSIAAVDAPTPELNSKDEELIGSLVIQAAESGFVPETEQAVLQVPGKSNPFE